MRAALVAFLLLTAACSTPPQTPIHLTATLVSPTDITLRWEGREPDASGHVLEFATEPQGPYTILGFLPPEQSTYTHPDLIPRTPFYYRLRPYYGQASAPVDVALGGGPYTKPQPGWSGPRTIPGGPKGGRAGTSGG